MMKQQLIGDTGEPIDKWNIVYILVFIQGLGILFPWNTLISATAYWDRRMCGSKVKSSYLNFFSIAFNIANVTFMYLCVRYQHRFSLAKRVVISLIVLTAIFIYISLNVLYGPDQMDADTLFLSTVILVFLSGAVVSIFQSGIFGLAACLPPIYSQAVMAGQGLAGVTSAVSLVVTVYSSKTTNDKHPCQEDYILVKWGAFTFFLISAVILLACVFGFFVLNNHPFVRYYTTRRDTLLTGSELDYDSTPIPARSKSKSQSDAIQEPSNHLYDSSPDDMNNITPPLRTPQSSALIFTKVKPLWVAVLLVFLCTLCVFPTVTSKFKSDSKSTNRFFTDLRIPIWCFLNFNLFDFVGRISAGFYPSKWLVAGSGKWLLPATIARLLFIPLFFLCKLQGSITPDVFTNDAFPLIFMVLFAFTNGLFSSLCMMMGPLNVEKDQMSTAGTFMAFGLNIGLALGSFSSFATLPLLKA